MKSLLTLRINGEAHELAIPHHWTLLEALRYEAGLTGSKQGCDKGDCGACTVLVDGEAVLSCCTLAHATTGEVTTIEGLATPEGPDPLQRAFDSCGALQCGFCQPGMILSARALLNQTPQPTDEEIRQALGGNLCRCTGYTKIFEAVRVAAAGDPRSDHRVETRYGEPAEGFLVLASVNLGLSREVEPPHHHRLGLDPVRQVELRQEAIHLFLVGEVRFHHGVREHEGVLTDHGRQEHARVLGQAIAKEDRVRDLLVVPAVELNPSGVAQHQRVAVVNPDVPGRAKGAVHGHHHDG